LVRLLMLEDSWHWQKWECLVCGATMVYDNSYARDVIFDVSVNVGDWGFYFKRKDVASQPIDDKWFVDMTMKKKKKAKWELNRNFQETWVTKFSWAKLIVGPSGKMHMVCWNMYSTMNCKVSENLVAWQNIVRGRNAKLPSLAR
jgi:hypothetical protein